VATRFIAINLGDLQSEIDQLFDDLLIQRWRLSGPIGESEHAIVHDYGDRYEVRIAMGDADPRDIEVDATENRLTVRVPGEAAGVCEGTFSFSEPIQSDAVRARVVREKLAIVLPKKKRTRPIGPGQS
jgi:HSP20 family molecular chaperone IbpA